VNLAFRSPMDNLSHLVFFLHQELEVETVSGDRMVDWWFDRRDPAPRVLLPEGRKLHLRLDRPLQRHSGLNLEFYYAGRLTAWSLWSTKRFSSEWIAAGLRLPWFPYNDHYGEFTFRIEAQVKREFQLRGSEPSGWQHGAVCLTGRFMLNGSDHFQVELNRSD